MRRGPGLSDAHEFLDAHFKRIAFKAARGLPLDDDENDEEAEDGFIEDVLANDDDEAEYPK